MTDRLRLVAQLKADEGLRLRPYRCTAGRLTIGYGRNLEDTGISEAEAAELLEHDIDAAAATLQRVCPWAITLDPARYGVLVMMLFQMGLGGFVGFRKMLAAVERRDYLHAALEMLDSDWARSDSPARAHRMAEQMRTGQWATH